MKANIASVFRLYLADVVEIFLERQNSPAKKEKFNLVKKYKEL